MLASEAKNMFTGKSILLAAYYCSPSKGSDWRVGWSRAFQASKQFEQVVVLTSELSRPDIEAYFHNHAPLTNLTFEYLSDVSGRLLGLLPKSFLYVNPFRYAAWQDRAAEAASALHQRYRFDLVHQVNLIGYREPGKLHQLGVPVVWGPIGGFQNFPLGFLPAAGLSGAAREGTRALANHLQMRFSRRVRWAMRSAAVVLAANSEAKSAIARHFHRDALLLLETGLDEVPPAARKTRIPGSLRLLWSGDLQTHKALSLLLRALGAVKDQIQFELRVLGRGPLEGRLRTQADRLGIGSRCSFTGFLPLQEAMAQSDWADVFVFTSLRDTSGNVMLEAMSRGVPVICLDHQGAHDIVTEHSGLKITVTDPGTVVRDLGRGLIRLATDPVLLESLSYGASHRAKDYLWSVNAGLMSAVYQSVLQRCVPKAERLSTGGLHTELRLELSPRVIAAPECNR